MVSYPPKNGVVAVLVERAVTGPVPGVDELNPGTKNRQINFYLLKVE